MARVRNHSTYTARVHWYGLSIQAELTPRVRAVLRPVYVTTTTRQMREPRIMGVH